MSEPLVVVQESEDGLYQQKWVFHWSGRAVVLQRYQKSRREKGKWRPVEYFDADDSGGYGNWTWLKEKEVPWDDDLKGEVAMAIVQKLSVRRPSDPK